ncbi:MAG: ATP-binding protein [Planctomycetota bacterium]
MTSGNRNSGNQQSSGDTPDQPTSTNSDGPPSFAWECDRNGILRFIGPQGLTFAGEFDCFPNWKALVHPHDRKSLIAGLSGAIRDGSSLSTHTRIRRHDGCFVRFRIHADCRADDTGRFAGLVGFASQWPSIEAESFDKSAAATGEPPGNSIHTGEQKIHTGNLREVQEKLSLINARFELAVRGSKVGIWEGSVTDTDWLLTDHIEMLLGYEKGHLKNSRKVARELIHPDDRELNLQMRDAHRNGAANESELRIRTSTGEYRWFRIIGETFYNTDGSMRWLGGTITDIDDIKSARLTAEDQVQQRDEFLAMLSHELRNPMSAIAYAAEFVGMNDDLPDSIIEVMEIISRQTGQMTRLMDDLLDVSRITRNKITFDKSNHDFASLLRDALECVRPSFEQRSQHLTIDLPLLPVTMHGDEVRLRQAITNLLDNASKYTDSGGEIHVCSTQTDGTIEFSIIDSGQGLPSDELPRIFELFYQRDPALHRSSGGLGVGLYLVKYIIESHGGQVSVQSDGPGHGCRFDVTLPVSNSEQTESRSVIDPGNDKRILVVEDNDDSRHALELALTQRGYNVTTFADGESASSAVLPLQPDVVIIDIGLPGKNGFELAREIRSAEIRSDKTADENDRVMLIALTGYGQPCDQTRALEAGFDVHMVKPANVDLICKTINGSAGNRNFREEAGAPPSPSRQKKRAPLDGARIDF